MDSLTTLSCPSCGANLEVTSGTKQFSCEYCGNTHVLLEALPGESSSRSRDKMALAQGRLMAFFDFKMEDLRCNREGKLSRYQRERFFLQGFISLTVLLISGFMSAFVIMIWMPFSQPYVYAKLTAITFIIIGLIQSAWRILPVAEDAVRSEVGSLGKSPYFTLRSVFFIGRKSFRAKGNPFMVLEWNVPYKVYYIPQRRTILSIEILDPS